MWTSAPATTAASLAMLGSLKDAFRGKGKQAAQSPQSSLKLPPFTGTLEQLSMAIDLGTAYSAVTVIHMVPGRSPLLHEVRFGSSGCKKAASRIWYASGRPVVIGSSCTEPDVRSQARKEGWEEAVEFKLHLHPSVIAPPEYEFKDTRTSSSMATGTVLPQGVFDLAPLPAGVDIQQVLSDYLRWLLEQTRLSFCASHEGGTLIWQRLAHTAAYVMTHPNGWTRREQEIVEQALDTAGFYDARPAPPSSDDDKKGKGAALSDDKKQILTSDSKELSDGKGEKERGKAPTSQKPTQEVATPSSIAAVASTSAQPPLQEDPNDLPRYDPAPAAPSQPEVPPAAAPEAVPPPTFNFEEAHRRRNRTRWLSEAEASLNYLIHATPAAKLSTLWNGTTWSDGSGWVGRGRSVIVVDAGGSTVDVQLYHLSWTGVNPRLSTKEYERSAECVQAGAVFPSHFLRLFISRRLAGSAFGSPSTIDRIVDAFDRDVKPRFDGKAAATWSISCDLPTGANDPALGIKDGKLVLTTAEVASFFDPSMESIWPAVRKKLDGDRATRLLDPTHHVFLTGGFGGSPYLRAELNKPGSILLTLPPTDAKPVATGAAAWYMTYCLQAFRCEFYFGIRVNRQPAVGERRPTRRNRKILLDGCSWEEDGWLSVAEKSDYFHQGDRRTGRFDFDSLEQGGVASIQLIATTQTFCLTGDSERGVIHPKNVQLTRPLYIAGYTTEVDGRPRPGQEVVFTLEAKLGPGDKWEQRKSKEKTAHGTYWHKDMLLVMENMGDYLMAFIEWSAEGGQTKRSQPQRVPDRFLAGGPQRA